MKTRWMHWIAGLLMLPAMAQGALTLSPLVSFTSGVGMSVPLPGLIQGADGNFYGTTPSAYSHVYGAVFQMAPDGTLTYLYSFTNGNDGAGPAATLVQNTNGDLYGTTLFGPGYSWGTAFAITTNGVLRTFLAFTGTNGIYPSGALVRAGDGDFYGVTREGGRTNAMGTIFRMTADGSLTTLITFHGTNGSSPRGLMQSADGSFYGTTSGGGAFSNGTVFRFVSGGSLSVLASFDGTNGALPLAAPVQATDGNFYGTTYRGGANDAGTVFRMTPGGALTSLYSFTGGADGAQPMAGLIQAIDGNLYGTTRFGGTSYGTVFRISLGGALTTLLAFDGTNGANPAAELVQGTDGNFYGTTFTGGATTPGIGTIFRLSVPLPPTFQSITQSNGVLALTWTAVAGQTYQLQSNSDLTSTNWINAGNAVVATNGLMSASDPVGPDTRKFYRVFAQ